MQNKPILTVLKNQTTQKIPVWMMRQAGRYLPEYRAIRKDIKGFLDLVYTPDLAAEVTMQPIRRFGMDGAILFSDILVIPHALGQTVQFVKGEGPKLEPLQSIEDIRNLNPPGVHDVLSPIYETVSLVKKGLSDEGFDHTALIGFGGAPWTVACYMVQGGGSKDFLKAKRWAIKDPDGFDMLIDILVKSTAEYCLAQIKAGAEVIKLFDSWAGILNPHQVKHLAIDPIRKIADLIHAEYPDIPVIGFPRGMNTEMTQFYIRKSGVDAVAMGQDKSVSWIKNAVLGDIPVQGNLDPAYLLAGGSALKNRTQYILDELSSGPFIFNLGHGIDKDTPPEHVEEMMAVIREHNNDL